MRCLVLITIFAASMLFTLSAYAVRPADPLESQGERDFLKVYDLSPIWQVAEAFGEEPLALIPFHPNIMGRGLELEDVEVYGVEADMIRDILAELVGEELFERNGVRMDVTENRLIVNGPEVVHRTVAAALDFLKSRLERKVIMDWEIYVMDGSSSIDLSDAAAVRSAAEKKLLRPLASRSATVGLGDLFELLDGEIHRVVWDAEPEIAEGSNIAEPILSPLFIGLDLKARPLVSWNDKQLFIGLFAKATRLAEPIMIRDLQFYGRVSHEQGVVNIMEGPPIDDPQVEFASVATVLSTAPGDPLVVSLAFPHASGLGSLVVLLSARLLPAPSHIELPTGAVFMACDFSHHLARALLPINHYSREYLVSWPWNEMEEEWDSTLTFLGGPAKMCHREVEWTQGRIWELCEEAFDRSEKEMPEVESYIIGNQVFVCSTPEYHAAFMDKAGSLHAREALSTRVEISFLEAEGPGLLRDPSMILKQGVLRGKTSIPMMEGTSAAAMAGLEGLMVYSYDVDVATRSSCPNPNIKGYLDGAVIHLDHEPSFQQGEGFDTVRVMVCLNRMIGPMASRNLTRNTGGRGGVLGTLDQPRFNHGLINGRFEANGKPHVLGSLTLDEHGKQRTLYVLGRAASAAPAH